MKITKQLIVSCLMCIRFSTTVMSRDSCGIAYNPNNPHNPSTSGPLVYYLALSPLFPDVPPECDFALINGQPTAVCPIPGTTGSDGDDSCTNEDLDENGTNDSQQQI